MVSFVGAHKGGGGPDPLLLNKATERLKTIDMIHILGENVYINVAGR